MDHHSCPGRRGTERSFRSNLLDGRHPDREAFQTGSAGGYIGDDSALRLVAAPIGEHNTARLAAGGDDLVDTRASISSPPLALSTPTIALTIVSAPPLPITMPKALVGHRFKIGKKRTHRRHRRREIEMQAPGRPSLS